MLIIGNMIEITRPPVFWYNFQDVALGVAVFSLPVALLFLQLMVIGLLVPVVITPSYIIGTLAIGAAALVAAWIIEEVS